MIWPFRRRRDRQGPQPPRGAGNAGASAAASTGPDIPIVRGLSQAEEMAARAQSRITRLREQRGRIHRRIDVAVKLKDREAEALQRIALKTNIDAERQHQETLDYCLRQIERMRPPAAKEANR